MHITIDTYGKIGEDICFVFLDVKLIRIEWEKKEKTHIPNSVNKDSGVVI
jgi:hypothetical protein